MRRNITHGYRRGAKNRRQHVRLPNKLYSRSNVPLPPECRVPQQRQEVRIHVHAARWILVGVITMVVLQQLFTYAPVMQRVFGTEDLGATEWMLIIAVCAVIYGVVGIEKRFQWRA